GRGRGSGCLGCKIAARRGDYGHATADEVGHEGCQAIELAVQPMVLDRHVLALDEAGPVETLTERIGTGPIVRPAVDEADDRQHGLLCTRRNRPRRHAAESSDELAPSDAEHRTTPTRQA